MNCSLPLAKRTDTISAGSSSILDAVDGTPDCDSVKHADTSTDRIVSFEAYDDGIGIMRDTQTAKPESFHTTEGWSVYNVVTNLAQLQ